MLPKEERHMAKESGIYPEIEFGKAHSVYLVRKDAVKLLGASRRYADLRNTQYLYHTIKSNTSPRPLLITEKSTRLT